MKPQAIRLVDVFLLGPFMVWAGMRLRPRGAGLLMMAAGVGTIWLNGRNFLALQRSGPERQL